MPKRELSITDQIDAASSFEDLKFRIRNVFRQIETHFQSKSTIYYVDNKTANDPSQYKTGDIIVDASTIPNSLVIYTFDAKKNKLTQSLQSFPGNLPLSQNEIFLGDGSNKNFNTQVPFNPKTTQVYKAGLRQRLNTDYTENTSTYKQVQFITAPAAGAVIIIDYEMAKVL